MWTTVYMSYFRCYLKLQTNGMGNLVEMAKILTHLKLTKEFTDMCIAAGCDYIENIRGIGINKAKKMFCENKDYLNMFQSLPLIAPTDYTTRK
jgi:5'-3' exonuclease